ncbi:MAG: TlpA family protein disulfide reductase, partial [Promethearchaeota archaeon]
ESERYASKPKKKFKDSFAPYLIILGFVFVSIIIIISATFENNGGTKDDSNPYETNITFTSIDGYKIKLADQQGKIVILFFFDLDCSPCEPEADIISDIDDDYSSRYVFILLISVHYWDSNEGLNQFKEDHDLDRHIVRDDSITYGPYFDIAYTPTTLILDKDGVEVNRFLGHDSDHYDDIKNEIDILL